MLYCDICFKNSRYMFKCNHSYCNKCNKKSKDLCLICNEKKEMVNFNNLPDDYVVYENLLEANNIRNNTNRLNEYFQNSINGIDIIQNINIIDRIDRIVTPSTPLINLNQNNLNQNDSHGTNNLFFPLSSLNYPFNIIDFMNLVD